MPARREFRKKLEYSLALDHPYFERLKSDAFKKRGREAAVLALFGFHAEGGKPHLLVTRRTERVVSHKGQMAFPGGMVESDETGRETALRETEEELGISPALVEIIGELPPLFTLSSAFWIMPFVGVLHEPIERVELRLSEDEIDAAYWIPLSEFSRKGVYRRETFEEGGVRLPTHVYEVGGNRIWGATGAMIRNLLERLERE